MKLRGRFALWFALAALVPICASAAIAWIVVSRRYRAEFAQTLHEAESEARTRFTQTLADVLAATDLFASKSHPVTGGVLLDLEKSPGGELSSEMRRQLRESVSPAMRAVGLDVFVLAHGDVVLAAPQFPASVDEKDPAASRLAARRPRAPVVAWEKILKNGKDETVLVAEAAEPMREGTLELTVLGGKILGPELIAPLRRAGGVEARLLDVNGKELASTTPSWGGLVHAPTVDLVMKDIDDQPVAHLVVAVSDADLQRTLRQYAIAVASVAGLAVLLAAVIGLGVSRRMTRDLDLLVEGANAVARGDLTHEVPLKSRDEIGQLAGAFNGMTRELAESKDRLIHAERVAAWQEIARSLAHEIKNPLTPIQMSVETMRKTWAAQHPSFGEIFDESTRTVLEEVQRLKKIVGEFSQFARLPQPDRRECDLNEIVGSALSLYKGAIKVVPQLAGELPSVAVDRDQLTQVVLNLLENARDAIASKGSDESVGRITVKTRGGKGGAVELEVEDNGPGFDPAFKEKLFTPYWTTKQTGTGLGLAIARRIVTEHGGRIDAHSAPGRGARFLVELPAIA